MIGRFSYGSARYGAAAYGAVNAAAKCAALDRQAKALSQKAVTPQQHKALQKALDDRDYWCRVAREQESSALSFGSDLLGGDATAVLAPLDPFAPTPMDATLGSGGVPAEVGSSSPSAPPFPWVPVIVLGGLAIGMVAMVAVATRK